MSIEKNREASRECKVRISRKAEGVFRVRHRWLAVVVTAVAVCLGCSGCGAKAEVREPEKTELRVVFAEGDLSWTGSMEWVAERFMEENPDISVVLKSPGDVDGQSFTDRLKVLIAEDEFSDVLELRESAIFAQNGYLSELPESVTSLVREEYRGKGACYAIPRYTTTLGILYNRDLFEKLGLSEPESYEDFLEICETIRDAGVNPLAIGGANNWHMGFWGNYLYQNYILNEENKAEWDSDALEEMLTDFRSLRKKHYVDARFQNITDSQTVQELSTGASAMLYSGPWMIDQIKNLNPQMEIGFFYVPAKQGITRIEEDRSAEWGISARCAENETKREAAVRFLQFFYSEGIYEHVLSQMNAESVVVRRETGEETGEETRVQTLIKMAKKPDMVSCTQIIGDPDSPDGFRNFYNQKLQEVLFGNRSLSVIATEIRQNWEGKKNETP